MRNFDRPFGVRPSGAIAHIRTHLSYLPEESFQRDLDRKRLSDLEGAVSDLESAVSYLEGAQKSDSARIWDLHTRLRIVEMERRADRDALLEWETKSRLAQGIKDYYVFLEGSASIPRNAYKRLKAEGCGYLPYLLSAWAVFYGREPANRFPIGREEEEAYIGRAEGLVTKHLAGSVESVWNSMQSYDRSLMISMFLSRRNLVVYIKPTIAEAKSIIDSDPRFVRDEISLATFFYLPTLVNKCSEKLFDGAGKATDSVILAERF